MRDAAARWSDPETSHAAAETDVTDLERCVLRAIIYLNGATTHEIANYTKLSLVSVSPRIRPLVRKNKVEDSGERRIGESGKRSIVWRKKKRERRLLIRRRVNRRAL